MRLFVKGNQHQARAAALNRQLEAKVIKEKKGITELDVEDTQPGYNTTIRWFGERFAEPFPLGTLLWYKF